MEGLPAQVILWRMSSLRNRCSVHVVYNYTGIHMHLLLLHVQSITLCKIERKSVRI